MATVPEDAFTAALAESWQAYRIGAADAGCAHAKRALEAIPKHGEAWYALACCHERAERLGEADRCFRRAAHTTLEPQVPPFRVPWRAFASLIDRTAQELPPQLRAALGEVTLELSDYADPELLDGFTEPELLGVFVGVTRADRDDASGEITPRLHLFRRAHEHASATSREFAAEVRSTLIHEFGHYLGYDEDDLTKLGWE